MYHQYCTTTYNQCITNTVPPHNQYITNTVPPVHHIIEHTHYHIIHVGLFREAKATSAMDHGTGGQGVALSQPGHVPLMYMMYY